MAQDRKATLFTAYLREGMFDYEQALSASGI